MLCTIITVLRDLPDRTHPKMKFFIFSSIFLANFFSSSGSAYEDEAVTSMEPLTRGNRTRRLAGGEDTVVNLFPHHVSLEYDSQTTCSGAIISDHFVLTAANCRVDDEKRLMIRARSTMRGTGGTLHHVEKFITHPNFTYNPRDGHDIAVVRVREAFKTDMYHDRIEMFRAGEGIRLDSIVNITSFGARASRLQQIAVPVAPCDKKDIVIAPDTFCAGNVKRNICFGDTGSPAVYNLRLVGIVSYGSDCTYNPGVITKVAPYHDWIQNIIHPSKLVSS